MSCSPILVRAIRSALFVTAMASAVSVQAQDAGGSMEEVIVTGSRIARPEVEATTPIQIISAESIDQRGSQNIVDILEKLPAVGTAEFSRASSNFSTFGNGVSTINLRNVEDQRTLVLINGRRVVSGIGGSSTVDINNIPTDLIKSVEVMTGGASAVYGSEAVAGVVNFILKDDFEGLSFRGQTGRTSHGDNDRHLMAITAGKNFGDTGNITLNVQYDEDKGLRSKRRKISKEDVPFRSAYAPQGRFDVEDSIWTYDGDNNLINDWATSVYGFNRNAERYISVPLERTLVTALGHMGITDTVEGFFEAGYSKMKSRSRLEPLAVDNSDARLPDGTILSGLDIDNPFIPAAIRQDMIDNGVTELGFLKRMNGVFDRSNKNDRDFYRGVLGLRGDLGSSWKWEAYVSQSRTKEDTASETALRDRFYYALDAVDIGGQIVCRDAAARAAGCQPFNPFGYNSASQEAADYIANGGQLDTYLAKIRQRVAAANLTGSLFSLPAGDVLIATGLEYRQEKSSEVYSEDTQNGNTMGNAAGNTIGKYHVKEAYLETIVPLLNDLPAVRKLDFEGAVRIGDYSTVGSVFSWKAGLNWAATESVKVRGMYSVATRAPNISELYSSPGQTFPTGLQDPCDGVTATRSLAYDDYCRSIPGIAAEIAANGAFVYDDNRDYQSIEGYDLGNPDVKEEKGKTITLGLVFTPRDMPNFSASIDYFNIKIKDAITLFPRQAAINNCVISLGTADICDLVTREEPNTPRPRLQGTVYNVDSPYLNAGSIKTAGVDLGLRYAFDFGLSTALNYTYLDKLTLQPAPGLPVENNRGQLNGDGRLGAGFKHRAQFDLGYRFSNLDWTWTVNYLSKIKDTLVDPSLDPDVNSVGAYFYHSTQARYHFGTERAYAVYLGIDNVFDKKPPVLGQNAASYITGTETAADSYDPIGRFVYMGFELSF
jgi:iron complex outermembrane receptor protein